MAVEIKCHWASFNFLLEVAFMFEEADLQISFSFLHIYIGSVVWAFQPVDGILGFYKKICLILNFFLVWDAEMCPFDHSATCYL